MIQLFGNAIPMAEKSLDFLWAKQRVIANNLANVDTPGYKTQYVTFEETFRSKLQAAAKTGSREEVSRAISTATWQVNDTENETSRLDENNVDADVELAEATRTALQYQYQLNAITSDITRLSTAIKGQ